MSESERTNDGWLAALGTNGPERDAALDDLHAILTAGLYKGLLGRVRTTAPEFDALAEDFVQEALIKILDNLDSFAGRSKFTTWAHKIAINIALTELRRKHWQDPSLDQITDREDGVFTPQFTADPAPSPENVTERDEMLAHVNRIITEELTDKQRTVMQISVIQDMPTRFVADVMDMKPNAVYKLLHDARVRLKQRLEADGLTPADVLAVFE